VNTLRKIETMKMKKISGQTTDLIAMFGNLRAMEHLPWLQGKVFLLALPFNRR